MFRAMNTTTALIERSSPDGHQEARRQLLYELVSGASGLALVGFM